MKCYSCSYINTNRLFIADIIGRGAGEVYCRLCCEEIEGRPRFMLTDNPESDWKRYSYMHTKMIAEGVSYARDHADNKNRTSKGDVEFTDTCRRCVNYFLDDHNIRHLVEGVDFGLYPSPCNCDCIYCNIHSNKGMEWHGETEEVRNGYERAIGFLEYGVRQGLVHPEAKWILTAGEISIHPYKDRIFELVKDRKTDFVSNCLVYEENIAKHLSEQEASRIYTSLDCGTEDTWQTIKRRASLSQVTSNLIRYREKTNKPDQIAVKYIVIPYVNDNKADYNGIINIIKVVGCGQIVLSRDVHMKYSKDMDYHDRLIRGVSLLKHMCEENGIRVSDDWKFTRQELKDIEAVNGI